MTLSQSILEVPRIERVLRVRLPDGEQTTVNRFDYNLAYCAKGMVKLSNGVHIRARNLVVVAA